MRRSPEEKQAARAAFRALPPARKLEHIWIYDKWFILLGLAAVIILGSVLYRTLTRRDRVLSLAVLNTLTGSRLEQTLGPEYLTWAGLDPAKAEVQVLTDLYLSEDASAMSHEAAYASRIKLLAMIEGKELDLVLMNREAYDILSNSGYLLELDSLAPENPLPAGLAEQLAENRVIVSDNAIEYRLGEAEEYQVETRPARNAVPGSALPLLEQAGFDEAVYLGVIANTPRLPACLAYLRYLGDGTKDN